MSTDPIDPLEPLAQLFQSLGQPARLRILLALGEGEACVCHLEALLGERQAYISQQLMSLKDAGVVDFQRNGRNIYYHLADPAFIEIIRNAASQLGLSLKASSLGKPVPGCPCPKCNPGVKDCPPENE